MTIVEIFIVLVAIYFIYRTLRPLRLKIESALFKLLNKNRPGRGRIIDINRHASSKKGKDKSE